MLTTEEFILLFRGGGRAFKKKLNRPNSKTNGHLNKLLKQTLDKKKFTAKDNELAATALNLKDKYNSKFGGNGKNQHTTSSKNEKSKSEIELPKETTVALELPKETPINASAAPLDINSVPILPTKNKGLRLTARKRLFLKNYGELLGDLKNFGKFGGIAGGLGAIGVPMYYISDAVIKYNQKEDKQNQTRESRLLNAVNTSVKSNNTNLVVLPRNNQSDSTLSESTLNNTSRTTPANTSNRNTQTTSNRLSLKKSASTSRNTSNNKSNTTSRKKLISKTLSKKKFADEFMKAYLNTVTDVDNTSTRDYYSEALAMKSQLDKQRKDEVAKLLLQVYSLLSQLNQLTNPIY